MNIRHSLLRSLKHARRATEDFLVAFKTPADWTHQAAPGTNHALWVVGHLGVVDNFFIAAVDPPRRKKHARLQELCTMGTEPQSSADVYPPAEEALAYMRERRTELLALLDTLTDEDLDRPMQPGTPAFLPDVGSVFEAAIWHEGMHAGQVSIARRSLGHRPLR